MNTDIGSMIQTSEPCPFKTPYSRSRFIWGASFTFACHCYITRACPTFLEKDGVKLTPVWSVNVHNKFSWNVVYVTCFAPEAWMGTLSRTSGAMSACGGVAPHGTRHKPWSVPTMYDLQTTTSRQSSSPINGERNSVNRGWQYRCRMTNHQWIGLAFRWWHIHWK